MMQQIQQMQQIMIEMIKTRKAPTAIPMISPIAAGRDNPEHEYK